MMVELARLVASCGTMFRIVIWQNVPGWRLAKWRGVAEWRFHGFVFKGRLKGAMKKFFLPGSVSPAGNADDGSGAAPGCKRCRNQSL